MVPPCLVLPAPTDGRLVDVIANETRVRAGQVVASLLSNGRSTEIRAPRPGTFAGVLVDPSQSVSAGEAVVWLRR